MRIIGIITILHTIVIVNSVNQTCYLPLTLNCPTTELPCTDYTIIVGNDNYYQCSEPLKLQADQIYLSGGKNIGGLILIGNSIGVSNLTVIGNLTIIANDLNQSNVTIQGNNQISLITMIGSNLSSSSTNNYTDLTINMLEATMDSGRIALGAASINIIDSVITTSYKPCLYKILNTTEFYVDASSNIIANLIQIFQDIPLTTMLITENLQLVNSQIITTIINIYVMQIFNSSNSIVNVSASSCKLNMGLGKGLVTQLQNGSFCTSGGSSTGYGTFSNPNCYLIIQYFMFLTHSFPYLGKGPYFSTGSGGYGYGAVNKLQGLGGGIIFVFCNNTIQTVGSQFLANGGGVGGNQFISGGSGGAISLYSKTLSGSKTLFSVSGGSSYNNNGSGSGGVVKISSVSRLFDYDSGFYVNITQGYQPDQNTNVQNSSIFSNGIFYGTYCQPGYYSDYLFCKICPGGTYSLLGNSVCIPCPYTSQYSLSSTIGNSQIKQCYKNLNINYFSIWIAPGSLSWLSILVYIASLVLFFIIGLIIKNKSKHKLSVMETEQFSLEVSKMNLQQTRVITQKLKIKKAVKFQDLMYHVHRITLIGRNTPSSPWVLPQAPPEQIKKYILLQGFSDFAYKFNNVAKWSKFQKFLCNLLVLVYPIYWLYYDRCKKKKYRKLLELFQESKEYNLLNNYDFEDKNMVTIKISKNVDYTICYIDFMVYDRVDLKYFNLLAPFIITLSGEGNFLRPFYLEDQDVFFNSLFFIVNRLKDKSVVEDIHQDNQILKLFSNLVSQKKRQENNAQLVMFLKQFNRISITLDLSAPIKVFTQRLVELINYLHCWNKSYFNGLLIHIDLILMISKIKKSRIISNQIHILANNDQQAFKEFIDQIIPSMRQVHSHDLKLGLFVFNPQQQIKKNERRSSVPTMQNQKWVMSDIGVSQEQSVNQPFISGTTDNESRPQQAHMKQTNKKNCLLAIKRCFSLLRYYLFSHRKFTMEKELLEFLLTSLIFCQAMFVFIWSIKFEYPYVFINIVSPFVGIIWIVSGSYGIGKLYLILNAMSLFNQFMTLIVESAVQIHIDNQIGSELKIALCQVINIVVNIFVAVFGNKFITVCRKLSVSQMFK